MSLYISLIFPGFQVPPRTEPSHLLTLPRSGFSLSLLSLSLLPIWPLIVFDLEAATATAITAPSSSLRRYRHYHHLSITSLLSSSAHRSSTPPTKIVAAIAGFQPAPSPSPFPSPPPQVSDCNLGSG